MSYLKVDYDRRFDSGTFLDAGSIPAASTNFERNKMKIKVEYDLESDGEILSMEDAGVQEIIEVPDNIDEDEISDWISDKTGWCVLKWNKINSNGRVGNWGPDLKTDGIQGKT